MESLAQVFDPLVAVVRSELALSRGVARGDLLAAVPIPDLQLPSELLDL